jgi:hypothetical protein
MYIHKRIIDKVAELFTNDPKYRDDKWGTIIKISKVIREELDIKGETPFLKIAFDVDRAFRYVQEHYPSLRGETWLKRQRQGGNHVSDIDDIHWDTIQLSLF